MGIDPTVVRDVVIVIPGIMGSELVDAEGRPVWSVTPGALARAIRTLGRSLRKLELPAHVGDDAPGDGIQPTRLLPNLHVIPGLWTPVTGYDGLLAFLRSERFHLVEAEAGDSGRLPNLVPFPYDWRLSNRHNGRRLARVAFEALERWRGQPGMDKAKLVLVCHSMGGLVARWFADCEGGAEVIRSLVTIGTPHRGALNALVTLANGLEPGIGPLRVPLTSFARSLPSLHQLLPQYDCLVADKRRVPIGPDCPGLDAAMLADAMAFHRSLDQAASSSYVLHKVAGIRQPTLTTARIVGRSVSPSNEIDGLDQGGDGTVPRLAAEPVAGRGQEVHDVADQHGELQASPSVLDLLDGILSREEIIWQAVPTENVGLEMADVWPLGDRPRLRVSGLDDRRFLVSVRDETDKVVKPPVPVPSDGLVDLDPLPEGGYRAMVASRLSGGPPPIAKPFLVLDPNAES